MKGNAMMASQQAPPALSAIRLTALVFCLAATAVLAAGSLTAGAWVYLSLIVLIGVGWLAALWLKRERASAAIFVFFGLGAAAGILFNLDPAWQLASMLAALCAWDLGSFAHRLERAARIEKQAYLVQQHVLQLAAVIASGAVLGGGAIGLRLPLTFIPALLLAGLLLAALIAAIAFLRRKMM
jgi:hypothetical protein